MLETKRVDDNYKMETIFGHFDHQYPLSFTLVGAHNIQKMSKTSKFCH